MILPTKGVAVDKALLSIGADVLRVLDEPKTVSRLWADVGQNREAAAQVSFDWFVLALDLLYLMGAIEYVRGRIERAQARETA